MYDPALGRWIQQDPMGYVDGGNLHAYVSSNAGNRLDPSGLDDWDWRYAISMGGGEGPLLATPRQLTPAELAAQQARSDQIAAGRAVLGRGFDRIPLGVAGMFALCDGTELKGFHIPVTLGKELGVHVPGLWPVNFKPNTTVGIGVDDGFVVIGASERVVIDKPGAGSVTASYAIFTDNGTYVDSDVQGQWLLPNVIAKQQAAIIAAKARTLVRVIKTGIDLINSLCNPCDNLQFLRSTAEMIKRAVGSP